MDLGPLTLDALTGPIGDLSVDVGPNKLGCYGLTRSGDAWVAESVDDIEYSPSHGCWHKRTGWAIGDIYKELLVAYLNFLEVEAGLGFS